MSKWKIAFDDVNKCTDVIDVLREYGKQLVEQTNDKLSYRVNSDAYNLSGITYVFYIQTKNMEHSYLLFEISYNLAHGTITENYLPKAQKTGGIKPKNIKTYIEKYMDKIVTKKETINIITNFLHIQEMIDKKIQEEKDATK